MNAAIPTDVSTATDTELVQFSRQGDQKAYGQIVERYQSLVCSIAYNRCGDLILSEDLAQDAFILAWQKLSDLQDTSKFKAWICTIARNLANRSSQRSSRSIAGTAESLQAVGDIASNAASPIERSVTAETEALVWQAMADVPENYREPLILFYREEQSVARVAEALDLSEDAVKQRLSRGRKMLQQHLAAVVETTLADSKPAKAFTGAVLLGISGVTAKTAAAAPVATTTAALAKSATSAGGGLNFLSLLSFLKLPVVAWLVKLGFDETRSARERQLLLRYCLFSAVGVALYVAALSTIPRWQQYVKPAWLQSLLPAAMGVGVMAPVILLGRRMSRQVERMRIEEGTVTRPKPLVETTDDRPIAWQTYRLFCLSSLLVVAGPAILSIVAGDWLALSGLVAATIGLSLVAAKLSLRVPRFAFQLFAMGTTFASLTALGIMLWRLSSWAAKSEDVSLWFSVATSSLVMTQVIVSAIAWKRVYGKPKS